MDIFSLIALAKANATSSSGGGGGSDHAVLYTAQSLTSNQKTQARENIGAGTYSVPSDGIPFATLDSTVQNSLFKANNAVLYESQTVPSLFQLTARQNIGAAAETALSNYATTDSLATYISELDTKASKMTITNTSTDAIILYPNKVYVVDHLVDMMGFVLRSSYEEYEEYSIIFTTGSSIPRISVPSDIKMPEGIVFDSNTRYEINIFDNYATVGHWELD